MGDIRARFLLRSGESRDEGLSTDDSGLICPAISTFARGEIGFILVRRCGDNLAVRELLVMGYTPDLRQSFYTDTKYRKGLSSTSEVEVKKLRYRTKGHFICSTCERILRQ